MLSAQIKELREMAVSLGVNGVCTGDLSKLYVMLREAANTIESLSDKLQGVMGTRYCELFGTPERAARTLTGICDKVPNCGVCQISETIGEQCNYDMLVEWLRGDA